MKKRRACFFTAFLVLASASLAASQPQGSAPHQAVSPRFRFAPSSPTGLAPYAVELADMDGDGKLDLLTANIADQETGTISVAQGNGNGTFGAPVDFPVGPVPSAMRVRDLNGDGRPDVICIAAQSGNHVNDLNSYVTVLLNNGSGGLVGRTDYPVGQNAHSNAVEVGDFNGDGWVDFAVASIQTGVHVYRNLGNGSFTLLTQFSPGFSASEVAVADLNNDGRVDLIVGSVDGAQIFFNNGGTSFAAGTYFNNYPDGVQGLATGDFDGDGQVDFVATGRSLSVYRNLGAGANFTKAAYAAGENQIGVRVADMDGDGTADITVSNYLANSVSVYSNNGTGQFADRRDWGVGSNPWGHAVGDVNGDGKPDIVAAASQLSQTTVNIVLNAGNRFYVARRDYGMPGDANGVEFADFNHDGFMDAVSGAYVSNQDGPVVFYGQANGTFSEGVQVENWGNNIPTDVAVGDFNGDGWADFATSIFSPGNRVRVNINRGDGTFFPSVSYAAGGNPSGLGVGDLNGDGRQDIVNSNGSQLDNSISVFIGNGDGTFQAQVRVPVGFRPGDVLLADFDRDGRSEVIVTHYGSNALYYFKPNASGVLGSPVLLNVNSTQGNAVAGDFDNDGWLDMMVGAGSAIFLRNNQNGGFAAPLTTPVPAGYIAAGDWDQDGLLDIVGTNGVANLALVGWNRGGGTFSYVASMQSGYETGRAGAADLNRDGLPEIVTANGRSRSLTVFQNVTAVPVNATAVVSRKFHNGVPFDIALPLTGTPGSECRSAGANGSHQVIVTFASSVTLSGASVAPGLGKNAEMAGGPVLSADGRTVTLNLIRVSDAQTLSLRLSNVSNGSSTNDVALSMTVLLGDVSGNGVVNSTDVAQTKTNAGIPVGAANFRADVTVNGSINSSDVSAVRAASGSGTAGGTPDLADSGAGK